MKHKVMLFDADGVVIKKNRLFSEQLTIDYGIPLEKMLPFFKGVFGDCTVGKADVKEELAKVIKAWGWEGTVDELMEYWFKTGDDLNQEILDLVSTLQEKGVHCYMTTNQEKYRGQYLREKLGNNHPFEDLFISGELGYKKNQKEYHEKVFKIIKDKVEDRSQVLFIDDAEENIEAAKVFGFDTILYKSFDDLKEV